MLKRVFLTEKRNIATGTAMLLGGFDGLHIGHRRLLACAKNSGFPVGIMTIVGGKEDGLFTFSERESIFRENGVDFVFELPFCEIKDLSPDEFIRLLRQEFSPKLFVCGEDFRFGAKAVGTPETLKKVGQVCVEILPLVEMDGEKVSSRYIKTLIGAGETEKASALLGERFFVMGEVQKDRQVGRTIGFPTANIAYPQGKCPLKKGVYETRVAIDGRVYKGITNYGARPTFDDENVWTETYLDGFDGDLYGRTLKVEFVRYLREVRKFDGAEDLKAQLINDIRTVREHD